MTVAKISIIIPVYNVEKYLAECLDSCINQTLEDIEIICVDDCSTDNSYKILEEYQQKDPRIQIFRHEENKKQGAARNKGLEVATGEYIWFVDSDDYIDVHACRILYDAIKEFDVDLLAFSALRFYDTEEKRIFFYDKYYHQGVQIKKIYYPKTNWKEIHFSNLNSVSWAYIAKKSVVKNFKFREGVWYEDADFTPILFSSVDSFCYIPYTAYFYRENPSSTTQTTMSKKKLEDLIKFLEYTDCFVTTNNLSKRHFLFKYLIFEIHSISATINLNSQVIPNNLNTFRDLQKKYYSSLNVYKKTLQPPKYSLKRFVGKVLRRFL